MCGFGVCVRAEFACMRVCVCRRRRRVGPTSRRRTPSSRLRRASSSLPIRPCATCSASTTACAPWPTASSPTRHAACCGQRFFRPPYTPTRTHTAQPEYEFRDKAGLLAYLREQRQPGSLHGVLRHKVDRTFAGFDAALKVRVHVRVCIIAYVHVVAMCMYIVSVLVYACCVCACVCTSVRLCVCVCVWSRR
jgi:hypothetical protein